MGEEGYWQRNTMLPDQGIRENIALSFLFF
jgi:hypothetical protein